MTLQRHKQRISLFLLIIFLASAVFNGVFGQAGGVDDDETITTNPKDRNPVITATVPDIVAPSAPILISPENGSLLNDGTPTFVWQESTDNVGIDHYLMTLDGSTLFASIPIVTTSNSSFDLVYDSGSGRYSLTPNSVISDGSHTWIITAYDAAGNYTTSATWSFTIDTNAPDFVITSVGSETTDISAKDLDSIPEDPIELEDNKPEIIGTGESGSTVQATVTIPGEDTEIYNFTIDGSGNWNFTLGILPRDEIITIDFIITDEAGNISILNDLKILIIQEYIIFPPTPTPTPSPSPTPTPVVSPYPSPFPSPGVSPTPFPTPSPIYTPIPTPAPKPIIKIPILPPEEIIYKIIPGPLARILKATPQSLTTRLTNQMDSLAPIGVTIATTAIPIISFLALLLQFGNQLSLGLILKLLQAIGLLPPKEPQGIVYDSDTNEPIAFALLTVTSADEGLEQPLTETVVCDVNGVYQGIKLPLGRYTITVSHQDYVFPTAKEKPSYVSIKEFYKGEVFEVDSENTQQLFMIPVDKKDQSQESAISPRRSMRMISRHIRFANIFWPLFTASALITLFYPTILNIIVFCFYGYAMFRKASKLLEKPTISGNVKNTGGLPISNVVVRILDPRKGELVALLSTNEKGYFAVFLEPNIYQIQINKNGYVWTREGAQMSLKEIDVTQGPVSMDVVMKDLNEIYRELFLKQ